MQVLSRGKGTLLSWSAIVACIECDSMLLLGWEDIIHTELGRTYLSLHCYESHADWRFFCGACGLNQPLTGEEWHSAQRYMGKARSWRAWHLAEEGVLLEHGNCHSCAAEDHLIGDCPLMPDEGWPQCSLCRQLVPPHSEDRDDEGEIAHRHCAAIARNNPNTRRMARAA